MRNFVASGCSGLKRKLTVSGTIALGTCSNTRSCFRSHAVPRSRVASSRVIQSEGRSFSPTTDGLQIRALNFQQRKIRGNIVSAGVNANLQQRGRRTFTQIDNSLPGIMPAAGCLQTAQPSEIAIAADPPEDHSHEHAFVNLPEQFFDNPAAGVCIEKRERRPSVQPRMRISQPDQRPLAASINGLGE